LATGLLWLQNAIRNIAIGILDGDFPRYISAVLSQTTKAKTTKLEDDQIAQGDGIVF